MGQRTSEINRYLRRLITTTAVVVAALAWLFIHPQTSLAAGASLRVSPSTGTYQVGSLIDVSVLVDTGGDAVNAMAATLQFPADKLQVVNPAASTSFISVWITAPTYSNTDGVVTFEAGLPNPGIKTSAGVITTITFRVKAPGKATLFYSPGARVLKNDGQGTNILTATGTAEFALNVPPPAGPVVSSPTHGDQNAWYNNNQLQFVWDAAAQALGYSFIFDQSPKTIPDETIDTAASSASVKATSDGVWFFHLRARTDVWGGVTTFPVQIDTTPPASFKPVLDQKFLTTEDIGTLRFTTTDGASGIDHYEVKIVARDQQRSGVSTLFIETSSPFSLPKLPADEYTITARAIDRAGNASDGVITTTVTSGGVPFYARVPLLRNPAVANTVLILLVVVAVILLTMIVLRRLRLRSTVHHDLEMLERDAQHKAEDLRKELDELHEAQQLSEAEIIPPLTSNVSPTKIPPSSPPHP